MNLSLISILTTLRPTIHIAAFLPFFTALMMWVVFYLRFDVGKLKPMYSAFNKLADSGEAVKDCKKENISFMDEMIVRMAPPYFLEAWLRMQVQLEKTFTGLFVADGGYFYDFHDLVTAPACRANIDTLWKSFWVLGAITAFVPFGISKFIQPEASGLALALGLMLFVILCLGHLIFTLQDQKIYNQTAEEYRRFIDAFNRVLPVTKADVALLLEAETKNHATWQKAADKIVDKFDHVVEDMMLPALEDSIAMIMHSNLVPAMLNIEKALDDNMSKTFELQEHGMQNLAAQFADRLTDTFEVKLSSLAISIGNVQKEFDIFGQKLDAQIENITETMAKTMELQEQSMEGIATSFSEKLDHTMSTSVEGLSGSLDGVTLQMEGLNEKLDNQMTAMHASMARTLEAQEEGMARIAEAFTEKLDHTMSASVEGLSGSLDGVRGQLEGLSRKLDGQMSAMQGSMEKTLAAQELGMALIASNFTDALSSTLQSNVLSLAEGISNVRSQMEGMNMRLAENIAGLQGMLTEQRSVLEQSGRMLAETGALQAQTLNESRELQTKVIENNETLNKSVWLMTETLDKLTEQTTTFGREAFQFTKETNEAQLRMSQDIKSSQLKMESAMNQSMEQYTKMNSMISDMMDNITGRMNEAMTNAGREIAVGIREVAADNAEAIANLSEQAAKLRDDYDLYFSRLTDNTLKIMDDMDYKVQGIVSRITEDVGAMMKEAVEANGFVLEKYKDNTTSLLQTFEEQALSIGLYAKEINLDVTDLSSNLRQSVEEFSKKMQEGVKLTIGEFDEGLSELSKRIANTVESICDAVETLPDAMRKG